MAYGLVLLRPSKAGFSGRKDVCLSSKGCGNQQVMCGKWDGMRMGSGKEKRRYKVIPCCSFAAGSSNLPENFETHTSLVSFFLHAFSFHFEKRPGRGMTTTGHRTKSNAAAPLLSE